MFDPSAHETTAAQQNALPTQQPVPAKAEDISQWDQFLEKMANDKNMQTSMIRAGLQMFTPLQDGQNAMSKIAEGMLTGMDSYNQAEDRDLKRTQVQSSIENTDANTEGTKARTEGQNLDNETTSATQESTIKTAESKANLAASQAQVAEITAGNEKLRQQYELDTADVNEDILDKKLEILGQELIQAKNNPYGSGRDKRGADHVAADKLASIWLKQGRFANGNDAWAAAYDHVKKTGVQSSWQDIKADLIKDASLVSYSNPERKQKIMDNINALEPLFTNDIPEPGSAANPSPTNPNQTARDPGHRQRMIEAMVGKGLSEEEAARRYDAKFGG